MKTARGQTGPSGDGGSETPKEAGPHRIQAVSTSRERAAAVLECDRAEGPGTPTACKCEVRSHGP